jgi:hypothetical protein
MQIMKLLPAVCAVAFCASFISVRAGDTPVQSAARGALEQKMSELDTQQTQAPPVVVMPSGAVEVQPSQPITNTVPAQAPTPAATATTPEPSTAPAAAAAVPADAAPAAATIAASESNAVAPTPAAPVAPEPESQPAEITPATPPPAETEPAAPTPEMKPAPTLETAQPAPVVIKPAPPAITPAAGTVPQSPAMAATIKVKPGVKNATNQINAIFPGKELGLKPIEAPLLPVSATQQAQLQALLAKYKANQITPEEYHNQRAEILAQP